MTDISPARALAERLQMARSRRGLTIQQMSEICGLPKSTLESYMSLKSPKRPGLDALIAIADGMGFSLDWLVGKSVDNVSRNLARKDYSLACFNTVLDLLSRLASEQANASEPIIRDEKFAGADMHELAAEAMFEFAERLDRMDVPISEARHIRDDLVAEIEALNARKNQRDPAQ